MDCLIPIEEDGKYIYKKLADMVSPLSWKYLGEFELFEKGFLPNGQGWNQESNRFIQAMVLINSEFNQVKSKKNSEN